MRAQTKLGFIVLVVCAMLLVGQEAQCALVNLTSLGVAAEQPYEHGILVPLATHNNSNVDTTVGIICDNATTVYWTFFSKDSAHLYDSSFTCTANDLVQFSLNSALGSNLVDTEGYLVFTSGTAAAAVNNNAFIAGNAFLTDTIANDAVYIPVVPLSLLDYAVGLNLTAMDADSLSGLIYGVAAGVDIDVRYWTDPAYGASTSMVVWTIGNPIATATVNAFDDEEHRTSLTLCWKYTELNRFNPASVGQSANDACSQTGRDSAADFTAWPTSYTDGFLRLTLPARGIAFSYVNSSYFGAAQTLLGAMHNGVIVLTNSN